MCVCMEIWKSIEFKNFLQQRLYLATSNFGWESFIRDEADN
jgi:hypothetical protein